MVTCSSSSTSTTKSLGFFFSFLFFLLFQCTTLTESLQLLVHNIQYFNSMKKKCFQLLFLLIIYLIFVFSKYNFRREKDLEIGFKCLILFSSYLKTLHKNSRHGCMVTATIFLKKIKELNKF